MHTDTWAHNAIYDSLPMKLNQTFTRSVDYFLAVKGASCKICTFDSTLTNQTLLGVNKNWEHGAQMARQ